MSRPFATRFTTSLTSTPWSSRTTPSHLDGDKADKAIYDGAIPGMLHVLDPHSNFYDPKAYAQMREDQRGNYYGVGMAIQPQPDKNGVITSCSTPFEGTPAFKAGIRPGDIILSHSMASPPRAWTRPQLPGFSKDPKARTSQVTMSREGAAKPLVFDLVRDEIPHAFRRSHIHD